MWKWKKIQKLLWKKRINRGGFYLKVLKIKKCRHITYVDISFYVQGRQDIELKGKFEI